MSSVTCCVVCGTFENILRCARCRSIFYCSKEHQRQDWSNHKSICKKLVAANIQQQQEQQQTAETTNNLSSSTLSSTLRIDERDYIHSIDKEQFDASGNPLTDEGSSEHEIVQTSTQPLVSNIELEFGNNRKQNQIIKTVVPTTVNTDSVVTKKSTIIEETPLKGKKAEVTIAMPISGENLVLSSHNKTGIRDFSEVSCRMAASLNLLPHRVEQIIQRVIRDLNEYGVCVVDGFLGEETGKAVLSEVLDMYTQGVFKDGQLVSNNAGNPKTVRGDQITWIDGREEFCTNIGRLISQVDAVVKRANKSAYNTKLGQYNINGRTKAMVACYPGSGSHYVKHVDNPNRDGRCITVIYYLNLNWNVKDSGGLLRIFPEGWLGDKVADIEPLFDRLCLFWSDRRNPHEVQPAFKTRYAITLWYFDSVEREEACRRYERERNMETPPS